MPATEGSIIKFSISPEHYKGCAFFCFGSLLIHIEHILNEKELLYYFKYNACAFIVLYSKE